MLEQEGRQRLVAVDQIAVGLERAAPAAQAVLQRFVVAGEPAGGIVPQRREGPARAAREQDADLALQPEQMPGQTFVAVAARQAVNHFVDDAGQASHVVAIARVAQQHEREVVAQGGEVAVAREQGGAGIRPDPAILGRFYSL